MKKRLTLILCLISLALFSCDKENDSDGSITPDSDIHSVIDQNGDFLLNSPQSFDDLLGIYPSSLIKKAEIYTPTIFINTVFDCSHCQKLEPVFIEALKRTGFYIETLHRRENHVNQTNENHAYYRTLREMQNYYGMELGTGIDGSTPRLYLANGKSLTLFQNMNDNSGNANQLTNYLRSMLQKTEIYHFTSFEAFQKGYEDHEKSILTVFLDESNDEALDFYGNMLYPIAKASKKKLYYVDIRRLDEQGKNNFQNYFSLDSLPPILLYQNESVSYLTAKEEATSLMNRYYS